MGEQAQRHVSSPWHAVAFVLVALAPFVIATAVFFSASSAQAGCYPLGCFAGWDCSCSGTTKYCYHDLNGCPVDVINSSCVSNNDLDCASPPPPPPPPQSCSCPSGAPCATDAGKSCSGNSDCSNLNCTDFICQLCPSGGGSPPPPSSPTYSWSAPGGSPSTGSGSSFSTQYGAAGGYTVTVTSSSQTASCRVNVAPPAPTLTGTPFCVSQVPQTSLTWTVPSSTGISEYHIERCQGAGCTSFAQIATDSSSPYVDAVPVNGATYQYRIRAHDHTTGLFSNYSNIVSDAPFCAPPPQADLVSVNLSLSNPTPTYLLPLTFNGQIRNQGTAFAGASTARFRLDINNDGSYDLTLGTPSVPALASNTSAPVSSSPTWSALNGTHKIELCADTGLAVAESNEANNCATLVFTVGGTPQADYIPQNLSFSPALPVEGDVMTYTAQVRNQGGADAPASSSTRLRIDVGDNGTWDVTPPNQTTSALAAGVTETESWSNAWTAVTGTHLFEVCADAGNTVVESSETNNCATHVFSVSSPNPTPPPPPPTVSLSALPSAVPVGGSSTLSWSTQNCGAGCICTASGDWTGSKAASGSQSTGPLDTPRIYVYTLSCSNAIGTGSGSASVQVGCVNECSGVGIRQCTDTTSYQVCIFDANGCLIWQPPIPPSTTGTPCGPQYFCRTTTPGSSTNGQCVPLPNWREIPPPMGEAIDAVMKFAQLFFPSSH